MAIPGKKYRIKGDSKYFMKKYGTPNPEIVIEGPYDLQSAFSPVTFLYMGRALAEGLPTDEKIHYGHVQGLGEVVHESELEEV